VLSAYGGCGVADYYGGGRGVSSGKPSLPYWDNCIWGSRNVTVRDNSFAMDATHVVDCTARNMCGFMAAIAFNAGVPALMRFWRSYPDFVANASGGLGNVWSGNTYTWTGPGRWQFQAGSQGHGVSWAQWRKAPYRQDAGSN
jgi:hypothetical protein